ncbi:putative iron-regulated protein [Desulfuromonas soudanensis]|uniref:Putative iron-regulated protein n=1 Tax=Desulfuromonas soudanensis TaxID=1603606 RepID=A0A0M4CWY1_9BACT|nr:ChaN family lipoprotein [Desulfuromonas soudanensis]ALC16616.1 putative iron-regulated protein [Desulfuromonas soudanensis]
MKRLFPILLAGLLALATPIPGKAHILQLDEGKYVSFAEVLKDLSTTRVVFMGELHDHAGHHRAQLQVIRALHNRGVTLAVGLEMFRSDSQQALDRWVAGESREEEFLRDYEENWSLWPVYREIFLFAREHGVKLVGLNLSRKITGQVASKGMDSLSPEQLGELPGVRCVVDPPYRSFIQRTLGAHVHKGAVFENFCEAQLLWDTAMARTLMNFLGTHPEHLVVVLAGSGHAWHYGIPRQLRDLGETNLRVLLPEIPGRIEEGTATANEADYLMIGLDRGGLH